MHLTRRGLLLSGGAAAGLLIAWSLTPRRFPVPPPLGNEAVFDGWLRIAPDGVITLAVPGLEMGQGITTLLPQIAAYELGADWRQIAVQPATTSGLYGDAVLAAHWAPLWLPLASGLADSPDAALARRFAETEPLLITAEGTALAAYEAPIRAAAASARALLAKAAAAKWGVNWEECEAQAGLILHGQKKARFGELAAEAARHSPPSPPPLRAQPPRENPAEFPPGAAPRFARLDAPAKVDGSYQFAGDVRLPDMVYAAIRHGPAGTSTLGHYDPKAAAHVPGFLRLVTGPDWLAAVGENWWAAERALSLIAPRFASPARVSSGSIAKALDSALAHGEATRIHAEGDPETWLSGKFEASARYTVHPALHSTLETASATARLREGKLELWLGSQAPEAARKAVAAACSHRLADVLLYPLGAGGSFDRRLEHDHPVEAALIAKETGRPVQLTWSRWQEHVAGRPRGPARAFLGARTAPDGSLSGLKLRVASAAGAREFGARLFGGTSAGAALRQQDQADRLALGGALVPYTITHLLIEHVPTAIGLPTGRLRGNGDALMCFLLETFIDELAARAGREPLSYRMAMLGGDVRLAQCLQRAATLAQWSGGSGQGLAICRMTLPGPGGTSREGRIALIVSARRDEHGIRVDRMTAVADIGRIINTDLARQQIEGGLIFGQALASGSSTGYADGLPQVARLGLLGLPLLGDCPEMEVEFISSEAEPFDPGELGVAVAAPAIANALTSAGGVRSHALPLGAEAD